MTAAFTLTKQSGLVPPSRCTRKRRARRGPHRSCRRPDLSCAPRYVFAANYPSTAAFSLLFILVSSVIVCVHLFAEGSNFLPRRDERTRNCWSSRNSVSSSQRTTFIAVYCLFYSTALLPSLSLSPISLLTRPEV